MTHGPGESNLRVLAKGLEIGGAEASVLERLFHPGEVGGERYGTGAGCDLLGAQPADLLLIGTS